MHYRECGVEGMSRDFTRHLRALKRSFLPHLEARILANLDRFCSARGFRSSRSMVRLRLGSTRDSLLLVRARVKPILCANLTMVLEFFHAASYHQVNIDAGF